MARRGSLLAGIVVVTLGALAAETWVFAPRRVEQALDALPRLAVSQVTGPLEELDAIVLLDDRDGWFLIEPATRAREALIAARGLRPDGMGEHVPRYCGADRGRILWGIRSARIETELAFCDIEGLDLRELRDLAAPIRLERDFLAPADVAILAAEVAADPSRLAVTLPETMAELPFERVVALPWIWIGMGASGDEAAAMRAGADAIVSALAGGAGPSDPQDFEITPAPLRTDTAAGGAGGPVIDNEGAAVVAADLGLVVQPVYLVRCTEAACAALDTLEAGAALAPWRDEALLDRALSRARPQDGATTGDIRPDREVLLSDAVSVGPTTPLRYAVRIAHRLPQGAAAE